MEGFNDIYSGDVSDCGICADDRGGSRDGNAGGGGRSDDMIAWNLFTMTGDPDDYMLYKKIMKSGSKDVE